MNDPTMGLQQYATTLALVLAVALGVLALFLPRRHALVPIVLATCFLPIEGKYAVAGMNFSMLRIVLTFTWARLLFRKEVGSFPWLWLDFAVLLWSAIRVLAFTLLWQNAPALINGLGYAYDYIGLYFVFRVLVEEPGDFKHIFKTFALALFPLAILMCVEKFTARNPFYIFGGVPQFPEIREGVIRCRGSFGHPILAGTFGAVWFPLFAWLWYQSKTDRLIATMGVLSSTLMTLLAGSSGPVGTFVAAVAGLLMWRMRYRMPLIRWGIGFGIMALALVMKDPVWFIFARIDVFSGSTGWHRANLIDKMISNFGDWWLLGARDISHWGVFAGDTTNQFIAEGVRGGILTMALFIWIIVIGFSYLGTAIRAPRAESRQYKWLVWSVGACLFAHAVSFFGVAYFDQNIVNWSLALALVAAIFRHYQRRQNPAVAPQSNPAGTCPFEQSKQVPSRALSQAKPNILLTVNK